MKLLLDTHTLFWWDQYPDQLSSRVYSLLKDPDNILLISIASLWEMQIKHQLGKMDIGVSLAELVQVQQDRNNAVVVPVLLSHVLELDNLPFHHRDPFDRILIAQARVEEATLVSRDRVFEQYDVNLIW